MSTSTLSWTMCTSTEADNAVVKQLKSRWRCVYLWATRSHQCIGEATSQLLSTVLSPVIVVPILRPHVLEFVDPASVYHSSTEASTPANLVLSHQMMIKVSTKLSLEMFKALRRPSSHLPSIPCVSYASMSVIEEELGESRGLRRSQVSIDEREMRHGGKEVMRTSTGPFSASDLGLIYALLPLLCRCWWKRIRRRNRHHCCNAWLTRV